MTSKRQQTLAQRMLDKIQKDGTINKWDLIDYCGMSITQYNNMAGWFKHRYQDTNQMIEYDSKAKTWTWQKITKFTPQEKIDA